MQINCLDFKLIIILKPIEQKQILCFLVQQKINSICLCFIYNQRMESEILLKTSQERYYSLLKVLVNFTGSKADSQTIQLFKKENVTSTNIKSTQLKALINDNNTKLKEQLPEENKKSIFMIKKNRKQTAFEDQKKLEEPGLSYNTKILSLLNQQKKRVNFSQKKYKIRKPSKLNRQEWENKFLNETISKTRINSQRKHLRTLTQELLSNPKITHYKRVNDDDNFQRSSMKIINNNGIRQITDVTTVDLNNISKTEKFLIGKPIQSISLAKIQRKERMRKIPTEQNQTPFQLKQRIKNKLLTPVLGNLLKTVTIHSKQFRKVI